MGWDTDHLTGVMMIMIMMVIVVGLERELADRVFSGRGRAHCADKTNLRRRPCNYLHRATPCLWIRASEKEKIKCFEFLFRETT